MRDEGQAVKIARSGMGAYGDLNMCVDSSVCVCKGAHTRAPAPPCSASVSFSIINTAGKRETNPDFVSVTEKTKHLTATFHREPTSSPFNSPFLPIAMHAPLAMCVMGWGGRGAVDDPY